MVRASLCSLAVLALCALGMARADDPKTKSDKDKNHDKATIAKVDAAKGTVTVTMKGKDGKDGEKTFPLADGAEYFDGKGKAAKIEAFKAGDRVLLTQKDGKISEIKKCMEHPHATITKVDAKKGTVTVTMKDKKGKDVEKTFQLMEDAEYIDSMGNVATIDVFQSGDDVLIIETAGKVTELKKDTKGKTPDTKKTGAK